MSDLVSRVAIAIAGIDEVIVSKAACERAIAAILDDLENPSPDMLEAFYRRWEKGHDPQRFNILLGDALAAMFNAKRRELALDAPGEPQDAPNPVPGTDAAKSS